VPGENGAGLPPKTLEKARDKGKDLLKNAIPPREEDPSKLP